MNAHLTVRHFGIIALVSIVLGGCANGDLGRVKPGLVTDDIHGWVGTTAALDNGAPVSTYPLTDDERHALPPDASRRTVTMAGLATPLFPTHML